MSEAEQPNGGNLADSIAMLEQILEVMPQDAVALKALYSAYRKSGDANKAFGFLGHLVEVAIGGEDLDLLAYVRKEFTAFEESHPSEVAAQMARIRTLVSEKEQPEKADAPAKAGDGQPKANSETDISEELALAWKLYEENQLTQEEYSSVLHDLTEISSKDLDVPVSVLHVLNDRGFTQMNRIINYMSNRSGVPFISLTNYELNEQVAGALPEGIPTHDGALPFAYMGNDLLVAVLNPFNHMLADKVESGSGHRCHTFLVDPQDYDIALGKLKGLVAKAA